MQVSILGGCTELGLHFFYVKWDILYCQFGVLVYFDYNICQYFFQYSWHILKDS